MGPKSCTMIVYSPGKAPPETRDKFRDPCSEFGRNRFPPGDSEICQGWGKFEVSTVPIVRSALDCRNVAQKRAPLNFDVRRLLFSADCECREFANFARLYIDACFFFHIFYSRLLKCAIVRNIFKLVMRECKKFY